MAKPAESTYISAVEPLTGSRLKLRKPGSCHCRFHGTQADAAFLWSVVLALHENDGWRYIGHVGTGFRHKTLEELHGKLITKIR